MPDCHTAAVTYAEDLLDMLELQHQGADGPAFETVSAKLAGLPVEEVRAGREKCYRETLRVALNVIDFLCANIARDRGLSADEAFEWLRLEIQLAARWNPDLPDR